MAIAPFQLTDVLKAIGVAEVFIGDPFTVNGMISLGAIEGNVEVAAPQTMNSLTAPEMTGGVPHQATTVLDAVTITVSVIMGDTALYPKISPTGDSSGGYSFPQPVAETSVLVIPRAEVGGGLTWDTTGTPAWKRTAGFGVGAATGTAAQPKNAVWFWRATPTFGNLPYSYANGGKVLTQVTFHAMFDAARPEGHKVFTIGNPRGVAPTPIAVIL